MPVGCEVVCGGLCRRARVSKLLVTRGNPWDTKSSGRRPIHCREGGGSGATPCQASLTSHWGHSTEDCRASLELDFMITFLLISRFYFFLIVPWASVNSFEFKNTHQHFSYLESPTSKRCLQPLTCLSSHLLWKSIAENADFIFPSLKRCLFGQTEIVFFIWGLFGHLSVCQSSSVRASNPI